MTMTPVMPSFMNGEQPPPVPAPAKAKRPYQRRAAKEVLRPFAPVLPDTERLQLAPVTVTSATGARLEKMSEATGLPVARLVEQMIEYALANSR